MQGSEQQQRHQQQRHQQQRQRLYRLAYLVSHPIQYQAPMLRSVAASPHIDLKVFFLSDFSVRAYKDIGFGAAVQWDVPLLDGYESEVLPALGDRDTLSPVRPLSYGLTSRLRTGRFDALWLHGYAHAVNLRAMAAAKMLGIKVFLRAESQMGSAVRRRGTKQVKEAALRGLFRGADAFLAIGSRNRDYYRQYGVPDARIFSVPYAVDNAFFQARVAEARPHREELRASLGLTPGRPVILYASKFTGRKRAGDLIEAYRRLSPDGKREREPEPYLLLIGDGEERAALEATAKATGWSSIRFAGFKNQTELPAFFDLCDVFVLVSEREPWGLIVNEVMNAAKPVIVSDGVGAGDDLVQDGRNGFVVPVGGIDALTERLRILTLGPEAQERRACMGARSREIIDRWGFAEDIDGLMQALTATVTREPCG